LVYALAAYGGILSVGLIMVATVFAQVPPATMTNGTPPAAQAFTFVRLQWESGRYGYGFSGFGNGPLWRMIFPPPSKIFIPRSGVDFIAVTYENKILTSKTKRFLIFLFIYLRSRLLVAQ
jgi:hypothetical protein